MLLETTTTEVIGVMFLATTFRTIFGFGEAQGFGSQFDCAEPARSEPVSDVLNGEAGNFHGLLSVQSLWGL